MSAASLPALSAPALLSSMLFFRTLVRLDPDLVHRVGIQFVRLMGRLADALARQGDDLFGALLVALPQLDPIVVESTFFGGCDQPLVALADLGVALDNRRQNLFRCCLFLGGLGEQVLPDHVAIGDDAGAQIAEHADTRQPVCGDVHGAGVDRPHIPHREQSHARRCEQQEGDDGGNLGADGDVGEHGVNLFSGRVEARGARGRRDRQNGGHSCRNQSLNGLNFFNSIIRNNA